MIELPDYSRLISKVAPGDWEQLQRIIDAIRELQDGGIIIDPPDPPDPIPPNVIRPEDYDLGSDFDNIAAAINEGIVSGLPVRLDGDYSVSAPFATIEFGFSAAERLTITGSGVITVTADFDTPVFTFFAPHSIARPVTSITTTTRTFPGASTASTCTQIDVPAHSFGIGTIIKLVAEDQIPGSTSAARRVGEFAYVADVDGDNLFIAGSLLNTYVTNIRIASLNTSTRLEWDGPTFKATPAQTFWDTVFIRARGLFRPRIRTGAQDGYDVVVETSSCFMADLDVHFRNLRNRSTSEAVAGYAINDVCSWLTRARISGADARHGYTTNTASATDSASTYLYGQTVGAMVTGSVMGNSAAAFDCHTESVDTTFTNCVTMGSRFGQSSSGGGYGMRGLRTRVVNAVDRGSQQGVEFFAEATDGCVDGEVVNFNYTGAGQPIRIGQLSAVNTITRPRIRGGTLRSSHNTVAGVVAFNCDGGMIDGLLIAPTGSTNGNVGITLGTDARVTVRDLTVDLANYTGTQFRVFSLGTGATGVRLVVERVNVINATNKLQYWFHGQSVTDGTVILSGLRSDFTPAVPFAGHTSLTTFQLLDGWQPIGSWTYSTNVTNVDFTNISYDEVRVVVRNMTKVSLGTIDLRVSTNNGSSYMTTSGNYIEIAADGQETALTAVPLHSTDATAARSVIATLSGLKGTSAKLVLASNRGGAVTIETASPVNAIRIKPTTGSITGGTITVLGR